ncbi:MAG TPA: Mpo1-like protein, partial [Beijerinckiaceae bacterium]|nr:Mpo1-like protein [Beijerinckiaceae bacterium]
LVAQWIADRYGAGPVWWLFAMFFVGGWAFQLVGHVFEGRRPALADNLFEAFIGPMFIVAEVVMMLGFRRDLARVIEGGSARSG